MKMLQESTEQRLDDLSAFLESAHLTWLDVCEEASLNYKSVMNMRLVGTTSPAQLDKMEAAALRLAKARRDSISRLIKQQQSAAV